MEQLQQQKKDLKAVQKRVAADIKKEKQSHRRAVRKTKTLPTNDILQVLRERGVLL